ncbi:pirin family protein [Blastomonas sp.]|uniref:pirin family protein n=1 Tax=Blastomonas sp. TaxID=1909299 RepID=UPI003593BFA4
MTSPISLTLSPTTHDLGGFRVRRVLPQKARAMVGPFIFVDEFGPAQLDIGRDLGVRPHPHIGLATVTYLFDGAIDHRDSLGTFQTIRPGEVNLMTAGSGIVHSERSPPAEMARGAAMFGMQTWLALPDALEDAEPAFENVGADALPRIEDTGVSARIIMGTLWGQSAPTTCHSPTIYADVMLGAGGSAPIDSEADERAVMLVDGDGALDGIPLEPYRLYLIAPGSKPRIDSITGGRAMLLGGGAFGSERHIWWNFVGSTNERIRAAADRWNAGDFPMVPGDDEEFIPIPEVPLTRGRT